MCIVLHDYKCDDPRAVVDAYKNVKFLYYPMQCNLMVNIKPMCL